MRTLVWTVIGGVAGMLLAYAAWVVVIVPGSQGFSQSASQIRDTLDMVGMNRLQTPWLLLIAAAVVGAVIGWAITRRPKAA
jgi:hypothetical protein